MQTRRECLLPFVVTLLLAASATAQTVTEFPLSSDACCPGQIAAGPDGRLWFSESSSSGIPRKIGRITTSGSVVDFPIEEGFVVDVNDIASGPDGNIWFTQSDIDGGHSAINRMTPAGVLTRYPTESLLFGPFPSFTGPFGITAGPDGNLWVTLNEANSVGQFTPGGELTRLFPIPTSGSRPTGITAGPDGNLWFTERSGNKVGRLTPNGVMTEFSIPTASSAPQDITTGSDGNLWFTESNANRIGRISPEGVVTEFPVPTRGFEIAAGPDGNLWFTQSGASLGRITTSGVVTEVPIPAAAFGITAGPDGNIWFTEYSVGRIGRFMLAGSPAIDSRFLPVVGSAPGVGGSFFRTSVQLHNSTGTPISGRIVVHLSGVAGSDSDPALSYSLTPGQTQSIADLLPALGLSGLGSADVVVTSGSVPTVTARVFNDAGATGTTGFTEAAMRVQEALGAGQHGVLLVPADLTNFRMNIGVRTLEAAVLITLTVRDAAGAVAAVVPKFFPATYHEQQSATAFLNGLPLPPGGSITVLVESGSAIVYGATVDNRTGDPSLQIAIPAP